MIPTSCVDNFYDDPDFIRNIALNLDYSPPNKITSFPGLRTKCLSIVNEDLYYYSIQRLLSCFFELSPSIQWAAETCFQKIYTYDSKKSHPINEGWIHRDDEKPFNTIAAVIYLNKDTHIDSGTKIVQLKKRFEDYTPGKTEKLMRRRLNNNNLCRNKHIDKDLYARVIRDHNDKYENTIEFKNRYNRMIAYDGFNYHQNSCFWVPEKFRLTQVFFISFFNNIPPRKKIPLNSKYS